MQEFSIVVAMDEERGIGKQGALPWHLPGDMKHFKELTTAVQDSQKINALIMGRKTWDSIPERFRPLKGRMNVVLTQGASLRFPEEVLVAKSLEGALAILTRPPLRQHIESVFVIGGGSVYREAAGHPACRKIFLTRIAKTFDCETFFPVFEDRFQLVHQTPTVEETGIRYFFAEYERL